MTAPAFPEYRVIALAGMPMVQPHDDLAALIVEAADRQGAPPAGGDVLVVTQRIVSKAEDRVRPLDEFDPSPFARDYAQRMEKDPRLVEAVLRESTRVVRQVGGVLITQTRHGFICANAGVDGSNVGGEDLVSLLPLDPDGSCRRIRDAVRERLDIELAVVMTDTFGRPWREGQTNVAIGVAGLLPVRSYVGTRDLDGRVLESTAICVADELAGAAELVMGKNDAIPAVIVRGFDYDRGEGSVAEIVRAREHDLFL